MRRGAGTKSKISFVLAGDSFDTGVRELIDEKGIKVSICYLNLLLDTINLHHRRSLSNFPFLFGFFFFYEKQFFITIFNVFTFLRPAVGVA